MHVIDVEMNDVEFGRHAHHVIQHGDVMGQMIYRAAQPQRTLAAGHQFGRGLRIAAGE